MVAPRPLRPLRPLALASLLAAAPLAAGASGIDYARLSDALAIGLPVAAGGVALAHDDQAGLRMLGKSEALTLAVTEVLKHTVREERPNGRDEQSFPSGHTSVSFAAAQYLQTREGWHYGLPAYLLAGVVGYSRVEAGEHYWVDVLAGAALGIASSRYLTEPRHPVQLSLFRAGDTTVLQLRAAW